MRIKKAQTFIEYLLVISAVTAIMISMSTLLRRSVQGMIKIVADHAGVQVNADQSNTTTSHIENMTIAAQQDRRVNVRDYVGDITYTYDGDQAASQTYTLINAGYTEE